MSVGCQGPVGPQGPPGAIGASGENAKNPAPADLAGLDLAGQVQPQGVTCTPGQSFCVNSKQIATCTLSGADAILSFGADYSPIGGTITNPFACVTDVECPTVFGLVPGGACYKRAKAPCTWTFTAPAFAGVSSSFYGGAGPSCAQPSDCMTFDFQVGVNGAIASNPNACPPTSDYISIGISGPRASLPLGTAVTLPISGISVNYTRTINGSSRSCSAWTGTLKRVRDIPSWQVDFNLTCSDSGNTDIQLIGTLSGEK